MSDTRKKVAYQIQNLAVNTSLTPIYDATYKVFRNAPLSSARLPRGSAAPRMLVLRLRILLKAWMLVSDVTVCCVGRGLCEELITHSEESYRMRCV